MPSRIRSAALHGIEAIPIDVEVEVLPGLPGFTVVGLGDTAVKESRERMTAALTNLHLTPPRRKTIVSLAPASLKKEGAAYDVPIALAYLIASDQLKAVPASAWVDAWFLGELGLDGTIRPVPGVLPVVLAARARGVRAVYIPAGNAREAAAVARDCTIYPVASLQELLTHVAQGVALTPLQPPAQTEAVPLADVDFADIRGQEHAKRALTIGAAGHHNVLLVGPPGTGKTLLARALPGILPALTYEEALTVTSLYSVAGLLELGQGLMPSRPFRAPHFGASGVALVGGGTVPKPGEVSLAHHGVLFLDELPEFPRHVLDQLRAPIEDGYVTVARAASSVRYPSRCMIVGAMNPCKCGYIGSTRKACQCTPGDVLKYQRRVSGPLLDRFDIHLAVPDVGLDDLLSAQPQGQHSADVAALVAQARARQLARQGKANSALTNREVKKFCQLDAVSVALLRQAEEKFHLSARSINRLFKVALTAADLGGREKISVSDVAEALQYREQLQQYLPEFV